MPKVTRVNKSTKSLKIKAVLWLNIDIYIFLYGAFTPLLNLNVDFGEISAYYGYKIR